MAMNYKEFGRAYEGQYSGVRKMNEFAELLRKAGELPERFPEAQASQAPRQVESAPRIEVKPPLAQAIEDYRAKPHTPELITGFQKVLWAQISEISGIDMVVPVVAETQRDIEAKENKGKGIIFVPETFAGQAQRPLIAAAFKLIDNEYVPNNWSMQADNPVKNDIVHAGYRFVDMQIEAPNLKTNEKQARDLTGRGKPEEGAEGMNLSEYALAGFYSKLLTGRYLDEPTWSRLLSSSDDGRVVDASFYPRGSFYVSSALEPGHRNVGLGARFSSGVKTA